MENIKGKVDLYFAGREGRVIAAYLSKKIGIPYDTPEAGIIAMNSVDFSDIPQGIFKRPKLLKKIEIWDLDTGKLVHPEAYHA